MKLARHDLVAALQLRYDHYSSQNVFEAACARANLADQEHYTVAEVAAFRAALAKVGDRLQRVDERLDSLLGTPAAEVTAKPEPAKPEPAKPEPAKPEPAKPEPAKAEVAKAEVAKAEPHDKAEHHGKSEPHGKHGKHAKHDEHARPTTHIILTGVPVADGETVMLCGERSELGNWDPEHARPMTREGEAWSAKVPLGEGSYKFLRRAADGTIVWEGGDNRDLGNAVKIETSWQA